MFGAHDLNDTLEVERVALKPDAIIIHEDWNTAVIRYDANISLLKFEKGRINMNSAYISPICIWDSIDDSQAFEGDVLGWGRSEDSTKVHENIPKLMKVAIQNNDECLLKNKDLFAMSSSRTFCGAGLRNGSGACNGDSGSGLFVIIDGIYYLKGIVAGSAVSIYGESCDTSLPTIYTNIHKFTDWIRKSTQGAYATKGNSI